MTSTVTQHDFSTAFATTGVAIFERALNDLDLMHMASAFTGHAGNRHAAMPPDLAHWLASHAGLTSLAMRLLSQPAQLVRAIAFDKTPASNWFVPWHQDRTIAVRARRDMPGFTNWTIKDGVHHVEPPVALLEQMVALRVHLDACDENQGPLEVVPGSYSHGRLAKPEIDHIVRTAPSKLCLTDRGDVLAMRPLTVHRSQRAAIPARRRVLHLEYAAAVLPNGLGWSLDWACGQEMVH